jgi:riboflavin synthase
MFTGIIEQMATLKSMEKEGENVHYIFHSDLTGALKIDQSLAHNGCCLTIVDLWPEQNLYKVTAIKETLSKTNLRDWKLGDQINIERSLAFNGRLDGHIVQGHVDVTGVCTSIENQSGSWKYSFQYNTPDLTIEKGSITINGVSLTVVDAGVNHFSVCIIPYTYEHTNFHSLKAGDEVNLEFDVLGKYVSKYLKVYENK